MNANTNNAAANDNTFESSYCEHVDQLPLFGNLTWDCYGRSYQTATFNHNGESYRATIFNGGKVEIYRNDNGLEMFVGYAPDVTIDLATAAVDAVLAGSVL